MKKFRLLATLVALCLLFCTACAAPAASENTPPNALQTEEKTEILQEDLGFSPGQTLADFTFTTYDGTEIGLYDTLAEKELVVINLWASWCGPCAAEFPHLEEAYQQFRDSVEIFALSIDANDTDQVLAEYAKEKGLTFPVGRDSASLGDGFEATSIPVTILVDRYGMICGIERGALFSAEDFARLFTPFLGEGYTGFVPPEHIYCRVEPSTEAQLAQALNAEGGNIVFKNVDSHYVWPFVVAEHEGRSVVVSSNSGFAETESVITAEISAQAGQVLFLDFSLSCEEGFDGMFIRLNDRLVKGFACNRDYGGYAIPIEETGVYDLEISYSKDSYMDGGEDCLRLDTVALLSGAEAEAALAANPVYLRHESTAITPLAGQAKEIIVEDPRGIMNSEEMTRYFSYWLIPEGETELLITIDETVDPDCAVVISDYDHGTALLNHCLEDGAYRFFSKVDSTQTTGYAFTKIDLLPSGNDDIHKSAVLFVREEDVDRLLTKVDDGKMVYTWAYADGSPRKTQYKPAEVEYTLSCVDEQGNPVAGVMIQICDDSLCQVYTSDDKGICSFVLPPYAYEVHVLSVPEGYRDENSGPATLSENGGSTEYVFKKLS